LKNAVANAGESKTQEEILLEVLPHRSGYFRGKGTAIRPYTKGRQQLLQQKIVEKQQEKILEQEKRIKELEESREQQQKEFQEHKEEQQRAFDELKRQMFAEIAAFRNNSR
jgi:malate synthase